MKRKCTRILCMVLSVMMVVSLLPLTVSAACSHNYKKVYTIENEKMHSYKSRCSKCGTVTEGWGYAGWEDHSYNSSGDRTCEAYLNQMEQQGLIVSRHGVTGADALHDLLNRLYVIPVTSNLLTRSTAFLHLTLAKHIPLKVTKKIFAKPQFNETEKQLMRLVKQNQLSVGELVKCVECGIVDVSTNDKLVDALYDDEETTYRNIGQIWRGCESNNPVLAGIATLYLNKHVIFDVLE